MSNRIVTCVQQAAVSSRSPTHAQQAAVSNRNQTQAHNAVESSRDMTSAFIEIIYSIHIQRSMSNVVNNEAQFDDRNDTVDERTSMDPPTYNSLFANNKPQCYSCKDLPQHTFRSYQIKKSLKLALTILVTFLHFSVK